MNQSTSVRGEVGPIFNNCNLIYGRRKEVPAVPIVIAVLLPDLIVSVHDNNGTIAGSRNLSRIRTNFYTNAVGRVGAAENAFVRSDVVKVAASDNSNALCTRDAKHFDQVLDVVEYTRHFDPVLYVCSLYPNGAIS